MFMKNGGEDLRCGEHLIRPLPTLSRLALLLDDSDVYCALSPLRAG